VGSTVVGKGNRILNDGTYQYDYDGNGNLTRRTTLVNGVPSGAYVQYSWDHRNQLTKIEFYNAPANGVWPLNKTVSYSYDVSSNRISKTLAVPGQTAVVENYVYDGDQLVAVMNATGAIQHEYFDGASLDQVFADQTVLSGVLWPLEDRTGAARDVISTAGVVLDHRTLDSFGNISSRSGAWIDYDQFFSGLFYDADSQLYYARARWYDATSGRFLGEDPLRFGAGDTNLSRYGVNDPINNADPSGMSWFSHALKQVGNAFEDVGHFVEKQSDNGNIQKGLLVAGTLASGGMLGFGLAAGTLGTMEIFAGALGVASGVGNSYEVFSGNRIGDGTFTRVLGAAAAVTGGFYAPGVKSFGTFGRGLSGASGLVSGYEIASGSTIGDGTLSSLFHVTNLGVNHGSTRFNANASAAQRFGVGLNLAVGGASVFNTGDRGLQQALRALSIASGVWNTGTEAVTAYQTSRATLEALRPTPIQVRAAKGVIRQVSHTTDDEMFSEDDAGWQPSRSRGSYGDAYLEAVSGNGAPGFVEDLLSPRLNTAYETLSPIDVNYEANVGYATTQFTGDLNRTQRNLNIRQLMLDVDTARTAFEITNARKGTPSYQFGEASGAYRNLEKKRLALEKLSGHRYEGSVEGAKRGLNHDFQDLWDQGLVLAPSGGNGFDTFINGSVSAGTGFADGFTANNATSFRNSLGWYSADLTAFNQDSYLYAGSQALGAGAAAYVGGSVLARGGAFISGFAPTTTAVAGYGLGIYGGYSLGQHVGNTIENWDNLSGPQRVSAIGVPIAGLAGGYAGYKSVPAETIFNWQSAGASSRAYTNRLASELWADEAGTIQTGYGAFGWEQRSIVQSTSRPNNLNGPANSVHVRTTQDGRAIQSTVFNQRSEALGHIDWKDLEGHYFSTPGYPKSGHGAGNAHIPLGDARIPDDWTRLPSGVTPVPPRGTK